MSAMNDAVRAADPRWRALGRCRVVGLVVVAALVLGPASGVFAATGGSRWGADYFPNVPLTTHEGKHVRFFDDLIEGKVVVINFIYTSCTDACPLDTARLAKIQQIRRYDELPVVRFDLLADKLQAAPCTLEAGGRTFDADVVPHESADLVPGVGDDDALVGLL